MQVMMRHKWHRRRRSNILLLQKCLSTIASMFCSQQKQTHMFVIKQETDNKELRLLVSNSPTVEEQFVKMKKNSCEGRVLRHCPPFASVNYEGPTTKNGQSLQHPTTTSCVIARISSESGDDDVSSQERKKNEEKEKECSNCDNNNDDTSGNTVVISIKTQEQLQRPLPQQQEGAAAVVPRRIMVFSSARLKL